MKKAAGESKADKTLACDIMKKNIVSVNKEMNVHDLAELFEDQRVTGVPVVDEAGKVIGVVSESDIVRLEASKEELVKEEDPSFFKSASEEWDEAPLMPDMGKMESIPGKTVEEIMTPWMIAVSESTPVNEIAKKMLTEKVHRVLVLDRQKRLRGIVTSMDLVKLIAENGQSG